MERRGRRGGVGGRGHLLLLLLLLSPALFFAVGARCHRMPRRRRLQQQAQSAAAGLQSTAAASAMEAATAQATSLGISAADAANDAAGNFINSTATDVEATIRNSVATAEFIRLFLTAISAPGFFFDHLFLAKWQAAYAEREFIVFEEAAFGLSEAFDTGSGNATFTPGQFWADGAVGFLQAFGASAVLLATDTAILNGTIPRLGLEVSVATAEGKTNVPARRRRLLSRQLADAVRDTHAERGADPSEALMDVARTGGRTLSKRRKLAPASVAALTLSGFWPMFAALLPEAMRGTFQGMLARAIPQNDFLARFGITNETVAATGLAPAAFTEYIKSQAPPAPEVAKGGLVTAAAATGPITYPTPALETLIPFLDIEFSVTLLGQPNVLGFNTKFTPLAYRLGANGFVAKSFKIVPNMVGFQSSTIQTLLARASSTLNATRDLLRGDAGPLLDNDLAWLQEEKPNYLPVPAVAVLAFEVYFREQVQVNGGDIANVI